MLKDEMNKKNINLKFLTKPKKTIQRMKIKYNRKKIMEGEITKKISILKIILNYINNN
jgi:hypothetical protein